MFIFIKTNNIKISKIIIPLLSGAIIPIFFIKDTKNPRGK